MPEMTAEQAAEYGKTLSFEKVWSALMENREQFRETDRKMAETAAQMRETDRKMAEIAQKQAEYERKQAEIAAQRQAENEQTNRRIDESLKSIKELTKNMSGVNKSLGKWSEEMFAGKLWEKFTSLGYKFTKGGRNIIFLEDDQKIAEVDVFLENGEYAMPVEVKVELDIEDVDEHLDRIAKIRVYMDKRNDTRKLVGAAAGAIVPESVRAYARKKGLYILVQSGDSVALADTSEKFNPRKW